MIDLTNYTPRYTDWTEEDYKNSSLRYCEPMTAHALEDETEQNNLLNLENTLQPSFKK